MEHAAPPITHPHATSLFGSFQLGGIELALSVSALREVVEYPELITQIPLTPPFLLGLFNLRGSLVPIVHLGQLLNLPDAPLNVASKIAIIEFGSCRVGLLFDRIGEILRVDSAQNVPFQHEEEGAFSIIEGVLKLDGGNRVVQILSATALTKLRHMPQLPDGQHAASLHAQRAAQGRRKQGMTFRVSELRFALRMDTIHGIIRMQELQHSVLASEACLGMLTLRGRIVPVIDARRFLQLPEEAGPAVASKEGEDMRRIIVLTHRDTFIGLLVDEVDSILAFSDHELLAVPSFGHARGELFAGCIAGAGDRYTILLNPAALFADDDLRHIMDGHHQLYDIQATGSASQGERSRVRETYVTFRLDRLMAVRIEQLREVIDYPAVVARSLGCPTFVRGVLKLRREMITLVDLRALYGMVACATARDAKVLVVECGGEKFGLVVDNIENILVVYANEKFALPTVLLNQLDNTLSSHMRQGVDFPDKEQRTLFLLDTAPLKEYLTANRILQTEHVAA